MSAEVWLPDDEPLDDEFMDIISAVGERIHLRLMGQTSRARRAACDRIDGLGQWWSGDPSQVNCPHCLELVHS